MLLRLSGTIGRALIGHRRQRQRDGSVHLLVITVPLHPSRAVLVRVDGGASDGQRT